MAYTKDSTVQVRIKPDEKAALQQKADDIGISLSKLLRGLILNPDKITIFPRGKDILKQLHEIRAAVEQNSNDSSITDQLERCADALCRIADQLTDLSDGGDVE